MKDFIFSLPDDPNELETLAKKLADKALEVANNNETISKASIEVELKLVGVLDELCKRSHYFASHYEEAVQLIGRRRNKLAKKNKNMKLLANFDRHEYDLEGRKARYPERFISGR